MPTKSDLELAHNIRNMVAGLRRRLRKETAALGRLSVAEENVLKIVAEKEAIHPSELCAQLNLSSQFVSQVLNKLEDMDYITRQPSKTDKRKTLISFSKAGKAKIEDARKQREEFVATVLATHYTLREKETIRQGVELLSKLIDI